MATDASDYPDGTPAPWGRKRDEPKPAPVPYFPSTSNVRRLEPPRKERQPIIIGEVALPVVGSDWKRRTPVGDSWDLIRIVALQDCGVDKGINLSVQPVAFGPVMSTTAAGLHASYERAEGTTETLAALQRQITALEAQVRT